MEYTLSVCDLVSVILHYNWKETLISFVWCFCKIPKQSLENNENWNQNTALFIQQNHLPKNIYIHILCCPFACFATLHNKLQSLLLSATYILRFNMDQGGFISTIVCSLLYRTYLVYLLQYFNYIIKYCATFIKAKPATFDVDFRLNIGYFYIRTYSYIYAWIRLFKWLTI